MLATLLALSTLNPGHALELNGFYVLEYATILAYDAAGNRVREFFPPDPDSDLIDVAINGRGTRLYALDERHAQVHVFDADETFLFSFEGVEFGPGEVAADSSGNVFVTRRISDDVAWFSEGGTLLRTLPMPDLGPMSLALSPDERTLYVGATAVGGGVYAFDLPSLGVQSSVFGATASVLDAPVSLTVSPAGDLFVADGATGTVERFGPTGTHLGGFGAFTTLLDVETGGDLVYVTYIDEFGVIHRVESFDATGVYQGRLAEDLRYPEAMVGYLGSTFPPALDITGSCPGALAVHVEFLTPGGKVAMIQGSGLGSASVPSGPCAGTALGLAGPVSLLGGRPLPIGPTGDLTRTPTVGAGLCGVTIQALDLSTCRVSDLETL